MFLNSLRNEIRYRLDIVYKFSLNSEHLYSVHRLAVEDMKTCTIIVVLAAAVTSSIGGGRRLI